MAKQTDKRRVFFVQLHIEEFTDAVAELLTQEEQAMFLLGLQRGCRGQGRHEAAEKQSDAFRNGYVYGLSMYEEAATQYERSRENGKRSAEARAQKHGSAQPKKPKNTVETPSTESRREPPAPFDNSSKEGGRGLVYPPGARFPMYVPIVETPSTESRNPFDNSSNGMSKVGTSPLRASRTQHQEARSQKRHEGFEMTQNPLRACAHAKGKQQEDDFPEDHDCDPDYLDELGEDDGTSEYLDRMRKLEFQRQSRSISRLNGAHA